MFGLSMLGPGNRTAEPVPAEVTRSPACLKSELQHGSKALAPSAHSRENVVRFHRAVLQHDSSMKFLVVATPFAGASERLESAASSLINARKARVLHRHQP